MSIDRISEVKPAEYIKAYNNMESKDSFISSSSNGRKTGNSFSSSIPLDIQTPVKGSNDKTPDSLDRPIAPVERLDESSNIDDKLKFLIGRSRRRSVSSGESTIESSTETININNDDLAKNKQQVNRISSLSNNNKLERKDSTSSVSDLSSIYGNKNRNSIVVIKNNDKPFDSPSESSAFSSVSNSHPNVLKKNSNRAKSAKTLTRQALTEHNKSLNDSREN